MAYIVLKYTTPDLSPQRNYLTNGGDDERVHEKGGWRLESGAPGPQYPMGDNVTALHSSGFNRPTTKSSTKVVWACITFPSLQISSNYLPSSVPWLTRAVLQLLQFYVCSLTSVIVGPTSPLKPRNS